MSPDPSVMNSMRMLEPCEQTVPCPLTLSKVMSRLGIMEVLQKYHKMGDFWSIYLGS